MADDYDIDVDDLLDMGDDGWLYVDDEYDLADELAEGQLANPGYCGTNYEIDIEGYEFDLFGYFEDLEYGDDAYWDYAALLQQGVQQNGQKRKRETSSKKSFADKRRKTKDMSGADRDAEPLIFRSRAERLESFFRPPPDLVNEPKVAFLADWKERFAAEDGAILSTQMPAAMKRAAEADDQDELQEELGVDEDIDGGDDWEDDEAEGEDGEQQDGLAIDPDMLKAVLQEKLGAAGLDGLDESTLMSMLHKMLSGDGDDAAGDLANALLGKVTSDTGDEAVSGWLSQQGVSLEEDQEDDELIGTASEPGQQSLSHNLPATQTSVDSKSPSAKTKKRPAAEDTIAGKKQKKVKFDVPSSSPGPLPASLQHEDLLTSDDRLASEQTIDALSETKAANAAASNGNLATSEANENMPARGGRKRKATSVESPKSKPATKKTRSKESESLGAPPDSLPSLAPPAKRTRSAKAKGGK